MIIKINRDSDDIKYPCLEYYEEDQNRIILFVNDHAGVVITGVDLGTYAENWDRDWIPFYGEVIMMTD